MWKDLALHYISTVREVAFAYYVCEVTILLQACFHDDIKSIGIE